MRSLKLVPPKFVDSGPVLENWLSGDAIDVSKFPIPRHHELDGGRYIGTGHTVCLQWVEAEGMTLLKNPEKRKEKEYVDA